MSSHMVNVLKNQGIFSEHFEASFCQAEVRGHIKTRVSNQIYVDRDGDVKKLEINVIHMN